MKKTAARASKRARQAAAKHGGRMYISYDGPFARGTFLPVPGTKYRRLQAADDTLILIDERMPLAKRLHIGLSLFGRLVVTSSFFDGEWEWFDDIG